MDRQNEIICMGLCSVDISVMGVDFDVFFRQETTKPLHTRLCVGGDAVNQSMTLSRLGHKVAFMGSVGDDDAGKCIQKVLTDQGVDLKSLKIRDNCSTATVVVMVGENDERHMCPSTDDSSNRRFDIDNVNFDSFSGVKAVSFCSLFCFPKINDEKLTEILQKAKSAGALTFADNKLNKTGSFESFKTAMPYLDYLFINQDEAEFYSGQKTPEEIAKYFMDLGVGHVIVKLGSKGSYITDGAQSHYLSTFDVKLVDTVGAGDNFAAGFISSILRGSSFYDSAVFATATAGMTVASLGSSTGVQNMEQVQEFLRTHKLK